MKRLAVLFLIALFPVLALAGSPACDGVNNWATSMAFVHLKNAGLLANETTDFSKTKTIRIASEKIGKDLYRQIHHVIFTETSGALIKVLTVNDASHDECSMSGVEVYVISKQLGGFKE